MNKKIVPVESGVVVQDKTADSENKDQQKFDNLFVTFILNQTLWPILDNDGKILPGNRLECLEEGIDYIRKNEEAEFANINQVDSADLCREICYVVDECFHWTWNKEKSSCHLKSEILKTGFR